MVLSDPWCCVRYNVGEDKDGINSGTSGMEGYGFRHVDLSELFSQIHGRGGGFSLFSNGGGRRFGEQRDSSSFLALSLVILFISLIGSVPLLAIDKFVDLVTRNSNELFVLTNDCLSQKKCQNCLMRYTR